MDWNFELWAALANDAAMVEDAMPPRAWHRGEVVAALSAIAEAIAQYTHAMQAAVDLQARFDAQCTFERTLRAQAWRCVDAADEVGAPYYGDGPMDDSQERWQRRTEGNPAAAAAARRIRAYARFLEATHCRWYGALDPIAPQQRAWERSTAHWAADMRA